jgi:2-dehydro-3-deoxyphosphogluconate aldolase / (4S)-4-hydroxy-2-oxoglutarate aldolase
MERHEVAQRTKECGIVAVFRTDDTRNLTEAALAAAAGGITVLEFTLTMPNALSLIEKTLPRLPQNVVLGAGTVLDAETARLAILAGAHFVVSPALDLPTIELCHRYGVPAVPGTFTPTEILRAWQAGADLIKLFPACSVGPRFIAEVLGPFPGIPFVAAAVGSLDMIPEYIAAGTAACCVLGNGIGGPEAYAAGDYDRITRESKKLIAAVEQGRKKMAK